MRVLIDTNIFIYREQDRVISYDLASLLQILNQIQTELVIHPASISEIQGDSDEKRRNINLSKIKAYTHLENPPNPADDEVFCDRIGNAKNRHDEVDNTLLFAVFKDAVDFFITEDRDLYKKAKLVELEDRVFIVSEAIGFFSLGLPSREAIYTTPAFIEDNMYNLNLQDPIFDSLRENYPGFDDWFKSKAKEGRKCFANRLPDGGLGAVFIYKIENESISSVPPISKKKRLKIATMKVAHLGNKIGELILKVAVDIALKNKLSEIYITVFPKHVLLIDLICEYGFRKKGIYPHDYGDEDLYLKSLYAKQSDVTTLSPVQISTKYYPSYYDGKKVKKFLIPIRPDYHDQLFTDYPYSRLEHKNEVTVEGNTIKKAYLTNSRVLKLSSGDIVIFYRTKDQQRITSIGIVDKFYPRKSDLEEILRIIGKRSVYSSNEIENFKKPLSVILFRHQLYLKKFVTLSELQNAGIISWPPQSISEIDDSKYFWIKKHGGIDENLTLH